jgi:hypothetical protein
MKIVGCDLHARQQTIAMVDTETGEFTEKTLSYEGNAVREFYAALGGPVVVGIEATLLQQLGAGMDEGSNFCTPTTVCVALSRIGNEPLGTRAPRIESAAMRKVRRRITREFSSRCSSLARQ